MGSVCSLSLCCLRKPDKKEHLDHLIRDRHCYRCQQTYLSNNEYNKHIVGCNQMYGDM